MTHIQNQTMSSKSNNLSNYSSNLTETSSRPAFSNQRHTDISFDDEEDNLNYVKKLDILKQAAPKFSSDLSFWPIFDTKILSRYSFAFYYYCELYKFLLKLLVIITIFTVIFNVTYLLLKENGNEAAEAWVFYGYGVVTIIAIRKFSSIEEKKVLRERDHQHEDWTENKFALLIENLPLDATKQEIKGFFMGILQENGYNENIKEIMLLQDCRKFILLEKELRKKHYISQKSFGIKQKLLNNITKIENECDGIQRSIEAFELYKGTAILIFSTVRGKILIEKHFKLNKIQKLFYTVFPWFLGKKYRLKGEILIVKEVPEPSDLIFEKVYVTKWMRVWRKYLAYFFGALAVILGIGVLVVLRVTHNNRNLAAWMDFPIYTYATLIVITTFVIYLVTDFLLEKLVINRSKSGFELKKVKFRLNISYLNINAYLVILMYFISDFEMVQDQIWLTAIILAIIIPLRKVFSTINISKFLLRRKLYRNPRLITKYSNKEIIEIFTKPQYDFANNVEDSVCFMFIALGFYFIGQLYVVITTLIGLIISILVDKFVMVHLTSPTKIKGSEMGLEFFSVLRWDLRLQLLTLAFVPDSVLLASIPLPIRIILWVIYGVFMVCDFGGNPRKNWKNQWSKEREDTKYEDVVKYFHHTYKEEYPFKLY